MPQLLLVDLTLCGVTPLDQLLPCMKINATIRSHGDSFPVLKLTASLINPRQGSHLLHYISLLCGFGFSLRLCEKLLMLFTQRREVKLKALRRKPNSDTTRQEMRLTANRRAGRGYSAGVF